MDLSRFRDDIARRPAVLRALADRMRDEDPWRPAYETAPRRVRLIGMGSSGYAAAAAATRLRDHGISAVAEPATATSGWSGDPWTTVVAVSATGGSAETLDAAGAERPDRLLALTNDTAGPLASLAGAGVVGLGVRDTGGVSALSYTATLVLLLALADRLAGRGSHAITVAAERAADAVDHLLAGAAEWVPRVAGDLDGPDGVYVLAPASRTASAQQSALMVRELPRRQASACETGEWSHVDVYLAKTLDYRALVLTGSAWEAQAADWLSRRGAIVVPVGGVLVGGPWAEPVRHPFDDDPVVALLVETTVAELVAAHWLETAGEGPPGVTSA